MNPERMPTPQEEQFTPGEQREKNLKEAIRQFREYVGSMTDEGYKAFQELDPSRGTMEELLKRIDEREKELLGSAA